MSKRNRILIIPLLMVLSLTAQNRILILGDSNGAAKDGWVNELKKLRPNDIFCNLSIAGNTIGFNNGGRDTLNTLKNVDSYIERAKQQLGSIDLVIILLGTNDCKLEFNNFQKQIPINFDRLIHQIKQHENLQNIPLIYVTPPPIADNNHLEEKYRGSKKRVEKLIPRIKSICKKHRILFLNIYQPLKKEFNELNTDGIHLNIRGAQKLALTINQYLVENNL